ncbi:hypothetical protein ASPBRDRAFT_549344 [Aspergillus brasiliensis CBS 101740]|uniref:Uncharacterized protein n=1 Tax=Aspergillus brasiliensis (strain CBS 101740 / IMI 381727 / IBT 21946) TaxID=767769 RepID=A0A1L9ULX4_ASPBC|nr:hypothetical protein ASPBRDRAFT_549344 [Aspergillus brasiliensis CBS 101740]
MASRRLLFTRPSAVYRDEDHELDSYQDLASSQPIPLSQLCTKTTSKRGARTRKHPTDLSSHSDLKEPRPMSQQQALSHLSAMQRAKHADGQLSMPAESFTPSRLESHGWESSDDGHFQRNPLSYTRSYESSYSVGTPLRESVSEHTSLELYGANFDQTYSQSPYESLRVHARLRRPETRITSGLEISGPAAQYPATRLERARTLELEREEKQRRFKEEVTALLQNVPQKPESPKPDNEQVPLWDNAVETKPVKTHTPQDSQVSETKSASTANVSSFDNGSAAHGGLRTPPGLTRPVKEAELWFHKDGRGQDRLRQQVKGIAENCATEKEKQTTMLLGDAILNLYSYVSEDRKKQASYFADYEDVDPYYCSPSKDGNHSYFD